jgi:phage gpG-like protein
MMIEVATVGLPEYVEQFEAWGGDLRELLRVKLRSLTHDLADLVRDVALDGGALESRTGRLRSSIYERFQETDDTMTGIVGTQGVPYAGVQELGGQDEYPIFPVKARVLAFVWNGAKVFLPYVLHPPLKARRYLSGSLESMVELVSAELNATVQAAAAEGIR